MCLISSRAFADDPKPDITKAPSGQYSIVQSVVDQGVKTVLHFRDKSKPDVILKTPPPGINNYLAKAKFWPGLGNLLRKLGSEYFISPDERWIIRDEHLAAGCNILVLYEIMPDGQVRVLLLNQFAFDCIGFAFGHYGHLDVEFVSWDIPSGLVHLEVGANQGMRSSTKQQGIPDTDAYPDIDRKVAYDLQKHRMIRE
jgi:hypothetical protein